MSEHEKLADEIDDHQGMHQDGGYQSQQAQGRNRMASSRSKMAPSTGGRAAEDRNTRMEWTQSLEQQGPAHGRHGARDRVDKDADEVEDFEAPPPEAWDGPGSDVLRDLSTRWDVGGRSEHADSCQP